MSSVQAIEFLICDNSCLLRKLYNIHAKKLGLNALDRRALIYIDRHCGLTQIELANFLEIEAQNLIRVLDRLCQQGYICKTTHPKDRRAKCVKLTDSGKNILSKLNASVLGTHMKMLSNIDETEQKVVLSVLNKLKINMQNLVETECTRLCADQPDCG